MSGDAEPWPEWREPPPASMTPFRDDAAFQLENLRAGIAQVSALVPFVGPAVAFAANPRGSFARREGAKAFNGQLAALLAAAGIGGVVALVYFLVNPSRGSLSFGDFPVGFLWLFALWGVQAAIGTWCALRGRDWTTPLARVARVQILPEGDPDPLRSRGAGRAD